MQVSLINPSNLGEITDIIDVNTMRELAELSINLAWSPAIPDETLKRTIKNTSRIDFIGLDIDKGLTLDEAKEIFKDYTHIVTTSRSHQKPKKTDQTPRDRFRVILKLSEPIYNDKEYKATWQWIKDNLSPTIDSACKDISRFFYPGVDIVSVNEDGELVDKQSVSHTTQLPQNGNNGLQSVTQLHGSTPSKGRLSAKTSDFLVNLAPEGERHTRHVKALFDMKQQGYSKSEAIRRSKYAFESNGLDWTNTEQKRVNDIYDNREVKHPSRFPVMVFNPVSGKMSPSRDAIENYEHLISNVLDLALSKNTFTGEIYVGPRPIDDDTLDDICVTARRHKLAYDTRMIRQFLNVIAKKKSFDPIRDPINKRKSKGGYQGAISRLIDSSITFNTFANDEINRAHEIETYKRWITKWLVGVTAKIYRPGAQNLVLVFHGAQGAGKSRWTSKLFNWCNEYFTEDHVTGSKDDQLKHLTKVAWHIAELDAVTSKKESAELKAFITKERIATRGAYKQFETIGRSICSFIASVNSDVFLVDETGNRRFLVVPIEGMDADHDINPLDVFAEALELLENGYQYWLSGPEIEELQGYAENYVVGDPVKDAIGELEPGRTFKTSTDILNFFEIPTSQANYRRLKNLLARSTSIKQERKRVQDSESGKTMRARGYYIHWPPGTSKSPKLTRGLFNQDDNLD